MSHSHLYDYTSVMGEPQNPQNLNDAVLTEDHARVSIDTMRASATSGVVSCVFTDLEARMVDEIGRYPMIVGCMAWLTNENVLKALAAKEWVQIVVQKEDFLRPDSGKWSERRLRALYEGLRFQARWDFDLNYNTSGDDSMGAVRCAGVSYGREKTPPRMHHKFLVLCDVETLAGGEDCMVVKPIPRAVWSGSFNATHNGSRSLENALIIRDEQIAKAYFNEWKVVLGLSEPLNWAERYMQPEYRIGT